MCIKSLTLRWTEGLFTREKLFGANLAKSDRCYLCLETKQDLKQMLVSCSEL